MEVRDAAGTLRGEGPSFRVLAHQGEVLTVHVFGRPEGNGVRGTGIFTLDVIALPQVARVEAVALLPGQGGVPGGPTTSLVLTLQGARLYPTAAQDPYLYYLTWLGPDGVLHTADDRGVGVVPDQGIIYDPGAASPTGVGQTITLFFADPLPAGSYVLELRPDIQAAPFTEDEAFFLSNRIWQPGWHPLVSLDRGQVVNGSVRQLTDLVFAAGPLGGFDAFEHGTPFLTGLHDDLGALLDAALARYGDDLAVTSGLLDQVVSRVGPALGAEGHRPTGLLVLWLNRASFRLADAGGNALEYDLSANQLTGRIEGAYVGVSGNVELVVIPTAGGDFNLMLSDVPATARGGAVLFGPDETEAMGLTDPIRAGTRTFDFHL
jgi:hypothetical protein